MPTTTLRRTWDESGPSERIAMMRAAGVTAFGCAYLRFHELPVEVKLDLLNAQQPEKAEA